MLLSIVIPAYNEEKRLGATLTEIRKDFPEAEIIVADDGSGDGTGRIAFSAGVTVLVKRVNRGKGYSVRRGMLAAAGEVILFTDADLAVPTKEFPKTFGGDQIRDRCRHCLPAPSENACSGKHVHVGAPIDKRLMAPPDEVATPRIVVKNALRQSAAFHEGHCLEGEATDSLGRVIQLGLRCGITIAMTATGTRMPTNRVRVTSLSGSRSKQLNVGWKRVYLNDTAVVFVREGSGRGL